MKKKLISRLAIKFCLSIFLISNTCIAYENAHEKTFYAVSSLHFHLQQLTSLRLDEISDAQTIEFNHEDVARLWDLAASDPEYSNQLDQAQQYYYKALEKSDPEAINGLYLKSSKALLSIWQKLDARLMEEETDFALPQQKAFGIGLKKSHYPGFDGNPYLTKDMKAKISPYLIPLNHPMKEPLDVIFHKTRAIESEKSFAAAGFDVLFYQPYSFVRVARHASLPGYLLKVYLDSESKAKKNKPGWEWLVLRCEGAENVRNLIRSKKLRLFSVPDKWLYPLPEQPDPKGKRRQPIILLVTDMQLVSHEECVIAWKTKITKEHLDELYCILSHGFASSHVVWNIPYSKSGKFTCIDTEHPKRKPNFKQVKEHLSSEMADYWNKIVKKGGIEGK